MKKKRALAQMSTPPPPQIGNGSGGPKMPDQVIPVKLRATLYARFLSILPSGADPAEVIADLVRQATKNEISRRLMQQIDADL